MLSIAVANFDFDAGDWTAQNMHATRGVTVWAPTFGVLIDNQGTLRPAGFNTVGRVDAKHFQQSATGQLFLKITGRRWLVEGIS